MTDRRVFSSHEIDVWQALSGATVTRWAVSRDIGGSASIMVICDDQAEADALAAGLQDAHDRAQKGADGG